MASIPPAEMVPFLLQLLVLGMVGFEGDEAREFIQIIESKAKDRTVRRSSARRANVPSNRHQRTYFESAHVRARSIPKEPSQLA